MKSSILSNLYIMSILVLLAGCGNKTDETDLFIESLADTIRADMGGEVVLTTGTGAYYYDNATGSSDRSSHGFYMLEHPVIGGWEFIAPDGSNLRSDLEVAIVHPEYCLRHYASGFEEKIEAIPGHDALAISFDHFPDNSTFRILIPSSANAIAETNPGGSDSQSEAPRFKATVQFPEQVKKSEEIYQKRFDYAASKLIGEPAELDLISPARYEIENGGSVTFIIIASDQGQPVGQIPPPEVWRAERHTGSRNALSRFTFRCEDKSVEMSYAWARLMLSAMYYKRDGESFLLAGIPHSPYMDCFHSALAATGLNLADSTRTRAVKLFQTILNRQQEETDSIYPSRLPVKITSTGTTYDSFVTGGIAALTFDRVVAESDAVPLGLATQFLHSLDKSVGAELNSKRLVAGLLVTPGLFENIGYPPRPRTGALFEVQALFALMRIYLITHRSGSPVELEVPEKALLGYDLTFPFIPPIAVGRADKQYQVALGIEPMLHRFKMSKSTWYDRLLLPENQDDPTLTPGRILNSPGDSTQTVVWPLSVGWLEGREKRSMEVLLASAEKAGLIGQTGFRSLAEADADFQSSHVYEYDGLPVDAQLSGDVLVWTAGMLADHYRTTERDADFLRLFNTLSRTVMSQGVIGGLPELENGVSDVEDDNTVRNPAFSSTMAEYVRILYDDILGIDTKKQTYPGVRITVPADWGKVEFSFLAMGATITLKRIDATYWTAEQLGSKDQIPLEVELWPEAGVRGYGSLRLNAGMVVKFKVIPTAVGRYTIAWDEFSRE